MIVAAERLVERIHRQFASGQTSPASHEDFSELQERLKRLSAKTGSYDHVRLSSDVFPGGRNASARIRGALVATGR